MFAMMAPFQPAPPPSSPFDWGREAHVEELLGDAFDLSFERHVTHMTAKDGEEY